MFMFGAALISMRPRGRRSDATRRDGCAAGRDSGEVFSASPMRVATCIAKDSRARQSFLLDHGSRPGGPARCSELQLHPLRMHLECSWGTGK